MNAALLRLWHRLFGHPWRIVPGHQIHGMEIPAMVVCDGCDTWEPIVLPPGHPDSMSKQLDDSEEFFLAELEDETWPEAVDEELATCADLVRLGLEEAS